MNDEQIAKLYDQALVIENNGDYVAGELDPVKFAKLVAQHERKVCAQLAVDAIAFNGGTVQMESHVRQAIEARGEA